MENVGKERGEMDKGLDRDRKPLYLVTIARNVDIQET